MTVQSTTSRADYTGNGVTTAFTVPFYFLDNTHVQVLRTQISTGAVTTLALTTDYTVTGAGVSAGGTITAVVAPTNDQKVSILRNVPFTQLAHYVPNDPFPAATHEQALDQLTMEVQQLNEGLSRALVAPANTTGVSTSLPIPTANKLIGWNATATGLQNIDSGTLATIVAYGTAKYDLFSGTGSQTAFTLSASPGALANLDVSISGVSQRHGIDFTWVSGTTLTFTSAPPSGTSNILVRYMQGLAQSVSDSASAAFVQSGAGAVARVAQDKLRELVSVLDFGAVAGGTAATNNAAFAAALLYATTTGKRLYVPAGTYALSQALTASGDLHIEGDGDSTVLDFSGTVTGGTQCLSVSGTLTQIQNVSSASKDNLSVTFASAPSLTTGDVFVIYNSTDYSWSGFRQYYRAGEWCETFSVSGSIASVNNPLYDGYASGMAVYKLTSRAVSLRNFRIKSTNTGGLIQVSLCKDPVIENVSAYNENYQCIEFDRCYRPVAINLGLFNKGYGSDDYGLVFTNCQHGRVLGGNFYSRRHGITMGGGSAVGCVSTRDVRVIGAVIKNDINSGVYSADFHGNTEDCSYQNCTIYNGVAWGGKNSKLHNCKITAALYGIALYASEIKGGQHILQDCEIYSAASPTSVGRAFVDVGGNSTAISANTTENVTFVVKDCVFNLPGSTSGDGLFVMNNNGCTVKTNVVIDGATGANITAMSSICRTRNYSGTVSSDFIIVDNISRFPSGTYLHVAANGDYTNVPQRMQKQTGTVALSAATGTAYTIASSVTFRYPYPRTPVGQATVSTYAGSLYNGNLAVQVGLYSLRETDIRPYIESGTAANWSATAAVTVNWATMIDDI